MFSRFRTFMAMFVAAASLAVPTSAAFATTPVDGPKVVFQISDAANASTVLRFVTNYLVAEPTAKIVVVGYMSGIDFMLADAKDKYGNPYSILLEPLAERGIAFKVCNNTLKSRNLDAAAVAKQATVVPSAVNEIIRLQTREGYAYFQHTSDLAAR